MADSQRRDAEQQAHLRRMDALEAQIASELQSREDGRLTKERAAAILQKENDLAGLRSSHHAATLHPLSGSPSANQPDVSTSAQADSSPTGPAQAQRITSASAPLQPSAPPSTADLDGRDSDYPNPEQYTSSSSAASVQPKPPSKPFPVLRPSAAKIEWERLKAIQGASNPSVDAIMDMTGLEEIKVKILDCMAKIDATTRQGASLKQERFNAVFLGNPGTGRFYS